MVGELVWEEGGGRFGRSREVARGQLNATPVFRLCLTPLNFLPSPPSCHRAAGTGCGGTGS